MSTTTNFNLEKPVKGEKNWDGAISRNFDIIDEKLKNVIYTSDTPPENPYDGMLWLDTSN